MELVSCFPLNDNMFVQRRSYTTSGFRTTPSWGRKPRKDCSHLHITQKSGHPSRGGVVDTRLEAKDTKKSEAKAKAKDSLSEDRHSRGQGQECSRPRPRTKDTKRKCSPKKKKKRSSQKFFKRSPRTLSKKRLEDSTIFWNVKILWSGWKIFWKTFFSEDRLKNFCEDLFFFFFLESTCALCPWSLALASSIPVLGLESVCPRKGCPWPWPRIFFVSLALASSLVSSTPPLVFISIKI